MKLLRYGLSLVLTLFFTLTSLAQTTEATVPDLTGLSVPAAATRLNQAGFTLGNQTSIGWTVDSGLPQGSIGEQSLAAGTSAPQGTAIDVSVLQSPNMRLVYDDNDLTVINLTESFANVTGLAFRSTAGASASFAATRWSTGLRGKQCLQIWSLPRNGSKGVDGCDYIQNWLTTGNTGEHFWTQSSGVQQFGVFEDGLERVTCPAAGAGTQDSPISCEFYYAGASAGSEVTEYLFFAYTPDAIALINRSSDKWMPTTSTNILNYNPQITIAGSPLLFGDPGLWAEEFRIGFGDISQLAPEQCLVFTNANTPDAQPPQPCTPIAKRSLNPTVAFWLADFEIESVTDGQTRTCPAARADRPVLCIVPR